jgi:hypothetical protein
MSVNHSMKLLTKLGRKYQHPLVADFKRVNSFKRLCDLTLLIF